MRFGPTHKATTYLAVWCAWLALVLSGELGGAAVLGSGLGIAASWWWEPPRVRVERWMWLWTSAAALVFAGSLVSVLAGADLVITSAELILFLEVAKLFGRRTGRDYLQAYVLSFLLLVASTVLNAEFTFGLCFLGYVLASTWALVLLHLRREVEDHFGIAAAGAGAAATSAGPVAVSARVLGSRRIIGPGFLAGTGALSLVVFTAASLLFLVIPRIGFGLFFSKSRGGLHMAGFSDGVELGGHGLIKNDDTVVMRAVVGAPYGGRGAPPLHWRGVAFDHYSHGSWRRSSAAPVTAERVAVRGGTVTHYLALGHAASPAHAERRRRRAGAGADTDGGVLDGTLRQDIYLEPLGGGILFGASMPAAFQVDRGPRFHPRDQRNDEVRAFHEGGIKYTVWSRPDPPPPEVLRREPATLPRGYQVYLQLPPAITPRVRALARTITRGATTRYDKAVAVENYLRRTYGYTLEMASPHGDEPIDFFLFERKKGHCEYFSSAMAVLLRAVDVPTRNVDGFLGGEWNEYAGYVAVRAGDAHSWVEVYIGGDAGWITFDPTPAGSADALGPGGDGLLDRLRRLADTLRFKWFKWVIDYDLDRQLGVFRRIGRLFGGESRGSLGRTWRGLGALTRRHRAAAAALLLLAVALVTGAAAWRARRRRRGRDGRSDRGRRRRADDPVRTAYLAAVAILARRGFSRPPSATPREHARRLVTAGAPGAAALAELTELYYAAEYSGPGHHPGPEAGAHAAALGRSIAQAAAEARRRRRRRSVA